MPVKYKFFLRLFLATFCAWAIPHIAYRLWQLYVGGITFTVPSNSLYLFAYQLALISGFSVGLIVALMQWVALRPYIESAWRWLVGLIFAWILGDIVNMVLLIVSIKLFAGWSYIQYVQFRLIGRCMVVAIFAGFVQQALLQKRTGIRFWWAMAVAFSIASAILIDTGNISLREGYAMIDPIYATIIAAVVMATLASLPTLLLKPVEKAGPNIPEQNPDPANSISIPDGLTSGD